MFPSFLRQPINNCSSHTLFAFMFFIPHLHLLPHFNFNFPSYFPNSSFFFHIFLFFFTPFSYLPPNYHRPILPSPCCWKKSVKVLFSSGNQFAPFSALHGIQKSIVPFLCPRAVTAKFFLCISSTRASISNPVRENIEVHFSTRKDLCNKKQFILGTDLTKNYHTI